MHIKMSNYTLTHTHKSHSIIAPTVRIRFALPKSEIKSSVTNPSEPNRTIRTDRTHRPNGA